MQDRHLFSQITQFNVCTDLKILFPSSRWTCCSSCRCVDSMQSPVWVYSAAMPSPVLPAFPAVTLVCRANPCRVAGSHFVQANLHCWLYVYLGCSSFCFCPFPHDFEVTNRALLWTPKPQSVAIKLQRTGCMRLEVPGLNLGQASIVLRLYSFCTVVCSPVLYHLLMFCCV